MYHPVSCVADGLDEAQNGLSPAFWHAGLDLQSLAAVLNFSSPTALKSLKGTGYAQNPVPHSISADHQSDRAGGETSQGRPCNSGSQSQGGHRTQINLSDIRRFVV